MSEQKIIKIGWEEYVELIGEVIKQVKESGFELDNIVAIARGGLLIGLRLSYLFDKPLAVMAAENWPDGKKAAEIRFARHIVYKTDTVGGRILLCDDLTDSGETLKESGKYLHKKFPGQIEEIRSATIFHKTWSSFKPDYFGREIEKDEFGEIPWILQPTENPEIVMK